MESGARQAEAGENGLKTERSGQDERETRAIGTDDLEEGESGVDEIELEMDLATDSDAASEADLGMNRKKQAMADLATDSNAQPESDFEGQLESRYGNTAGSKSGT